MKRFKHIFSAILAVILINLTTEVAAHDFSRDKDSDISVQNSRVNEEATAWLDSVDISLLTCGPGQEVWSYYGHTALRIEDKVHGTDLAVNWGMFSFQQDFFILRFDGGMKAVNPAYETRKEHFPIIHPKFSRDFAFHFAVGYPF